RKRSDIGPVGRKGRRTTVATTLGARLRAELGTPEKRLRWLVRFAQTDLDQEVPEAAWIEWWNFAFHLQSGGSQYGSHPVDARRRQILREARQALHDCFRALSAGEAYTIYPERIQWIFEPDGDRVARSNELNVVTAHLRTQLVFRAIDLLDEVGVR